MDHARRSVRLLLPLAALIGLSAAVSGPARAQITPQTVQLIDRLCSQTLRTNEEDRLYGMISLAVRATIRYRGAEFRPDVIDDAVQDSLDAMIEALSWLLLQQVTVVNISLVGPPNLLMENAVRRVIAHGVLIVAAVGNDGPTAPPLYPASYADVIGVTAVDRRDQVLPEAARGHQVSFAAPGADMSAAGNSGTYVLVRGTSFAAPLVAGLLAAQPHELNRAAALEAIAALAREATPKGKTGRDSLYGLGLVGAGLRPSAALAGRHIER